jgi:hypothetical protein
MPIACPHQKILLKSILSTLDLSVMPPDAKYGGSERYSKMSSILLSLPLAMFLAENLREETDIPFSYWVAVLSRG